MTRFFCFTDGAVDRNTVGGAALGGACAVVLRIEDDIEEMAVWGKFFKNGFISNNTMELTAVGLAGRYLQKRIAEKVEVHIWTDSQYAQGCLRYGSNWMPEKNIDMISEMRGYVAYPNVQIHHVRGHSGVAWNVLADTGATKAVERKQGFLGFRTVKIPMKCFYCARFACRDPKFGKVTEMGEYSPPPCGGKEFKPYDRSLGQSLWEAEPAAVTEGVRGSDGGPCPLRGEAEVSQVQGRGDGVRPAAGPDHQANGDLGTQRPYLWEDREDPHGGADL